MCKIMLQGFNLDMNIFKTGSFVPGLMCTHKKRALRGINTIIIVQVIKASSKII